MPVPSPDKWGRLRQEGHPAQNFCQFIMRSPVNNFIPDRSRPGLTTATTGTVVQQGTSGNYVTDGQRRQRGQRRKPGRRIQRLRERRKAKSVEVRAATLNVASMTGKGRELIDMMERRKVDILCVQETKWKGSKAKSIGDGFKLLYHGVDGRRNGVSIILKEYYAKSVVEVKRKSGRMMCVKMEIEGVMMNIISAYVPQVGCELEEKEDFWNDLDKMVECA